MGKTEEYQVVWNFKHPWVQELVEQELGRKIDILRLRTSYWSHKYKIRKKGRREADLQLVEDIDRMNEAENAEQIEFEAGVYICPKNYIFCPSTICRNHIFFP